MQGKVQHFLCFHMEVPKKMLTAVCTRCWTAGGKC